MQFCGSSSVSGIIDNMTETYKDRWNINAMPKYNVLTVPMKVLLELENINYIDFLSIDVQGAELDVLLSMNWTIPTYCICIELEGHDKIKDEKCRLILRENGFVFKDKLHISEFWVNYSYFRLNKLYDPSVESSIADFNLNYFKPNWVLKLNDKFVSRV